MAGATCNKNQAHKEQSVSSFRISLPAGCCPQRLQTLLQIVLLQPLLWGNIKVVVLFYLLEGSASMTESIDGIALKNNEHLNGTS